MRRRHSARAVVGVGALLGIMTIAAAGCEEFDDPSTIKDLRLLAASLEPAEIILDPAAPGASLPALRLSPLLVDGARTGAQSRPITFSLRACANDPLAPSAPGSGGEAAGNYPAGGARSSVGSARCPADSAVSWTLPVMPAPAPMASADAPSFMVALTAEQIAAAFQVDVFPGHLGHLHGGFDLGLPIAFEITARAGDEIVTGVKRLIVWPGPIAPDHHANQNPQIDQLLGYPERDVTTLLPVGPTSVLANDTPAVVSAGHGFWIEPRGAVAEPYLTTVIDRLTDLTHADAVPAETLRYSFFATAGKFEPNETTSELAFGATTTTARIPIEARYLAPDTAATPLMVRIIVVVRDERGGTSWIERPLVVTP
jgi:hypothetical protein